MISLLCWYLSGYLVFRLLVRRPPSLGAALAFGMALGVLLRAATVVAGLGHALHVTLQLALTIGLGLTVLLRGPRTVTDRFRLAPPRASLGGMALSAALVLAAGSGVLVLTRFIGVPPANFDVLSYHLPLATAMLDPGSASAVFWAPETFYARMPLGAAMLEEPFVARASGGPFGIGIQVLMLASVLATAASAAAIVGSLGGRTHARFLAGVLVLLHPMAAGGVLQSLQEPLMGLMAMGALELAVRGVRGNRALMLAAGLTAGTAASIKLSAVGVVLIPQAIAVALFMIRDLRSAPRDFVLRSVWWGVGALTALAPWFTRGTVVGGHPLHPFKGFSDEWTQAQAEFVVQVHGPQSVLSSSYWDDAVAKISHFDFGLGGVSLMLLGGVLSLASARGRRGAPILVAALLAYAAYLTVAGNPTRFLYAGVVILAPLTAHAIGSLRMDPQWRLAPLAIGLLLCFLPSIPHLRTSRQFDPVYTTPMRREMMGEYVGRELIPMAEMASDLAESGRLLLVFESRPILFRAPTESRTVWDQASYAEDLKAARDDEDFARKLRARGITAIFVNEVEWGRYLDFYAREAMGPGDPRMGRITIAGPLASEERRNGLLHFPPHVAAGITMREVEILEAFLRTLRRSTIVSTAAGQAEIWAARIPPTDSGKAPE